MYADGDWQAVVLSKDMATANEYHPDRKLKPSTTKAVLAVFHFNNKEAKRELKVNHNNEALPLCSEATYLGERLDRTVTYFQHLESLSKKLTSSIALLRWLAGSGWGAGATTLRKAPYPWSIQQQSTALLSGATVLASASLTLPSMTPYKLRLNACILHQRTIFLSSQASNLLSLVTNEPHCLQHAIPWSLDNCSTQRSPVHRVGMHGISNRDTHFVPAAQQLISSSDDNNKSAVECRKIGVHYETPYFYPQPKHLEWH